MRERILNYSKFIKNLIENNDCDTDWEIILKDLLIQINFFQHERLIHLIVTVTFALLEIISISLTLLSDNLMTIVLALAILVLLIPYIRHYYLLENEVQKMYSYYDQINIFLQKKNGRN